mmetsp:Transcript_1074/g.2113  ORF Transcript_1074/g.2113 Transcript_1074/m.2113 type:complete len:669 (-) Transcript_1074:305-2311(-)|eukprot:CAMPEP_0113660000 /NCGR_PEP_ID=MMETSP0017_2-20120614/32661_1 /TAXON_ID=2856 /ORGANISM="Cylindrotheca closterium" /LENGTH=668 /DNA_ID=CAMNT_0000574595 /DNA_START=273 /DNA_END=2279 /DNA_ORIENTATION=+ /assembly_acc=CAM_ASM_000147
MALPWMHDTVPLTKSIPFDIDEMPDVLAADEGRNIHFNHMTSIVNKKERKPKDTLARSSASLRSVARRSSDPGIIDLTSTIQYKDERNLRSHSKGNTVSFRSKKSLPGEIALHTFEIEHRRKRTMQDHAKTIIRKKYWSVRINSTSSKASILPSNLAGYLEARLPAEVQDGRFLSMKRAKAIAKALGTYDCRHGLPPTNPTGKNANRVTVGRTRRMWTSKSPSDKPQRVFFTSLLTGEKLDSGSQKRPRDVRLAIKIDGEYFSGENSSQYSPLAPTNSWCTRQYARAKKQCVIDPNNYVSLLLKDGNRREIGVISDQERFKVDGESYFREPQFECLPDNTGVICVTCTSPGNITMTSLHSILNSAAKRNSIHCTVCWATGSSQLGEVQACSVCGLLAHLQCCLDPGEVSRIAKGGTIVAKWTCAMCCARRQQCPNDPGGSVCKHPENQRVADPPSGLIDAPLKFDAGEVGQSSWPFEQKCALCPYSGGAMSPVSIGDTTHWVHEVCRIWTDVAMVPETRHQSTNRKSGICALCGADEATRFKAKNSLMKCAASNCHVQFHPMCSLVATNLQNHASLHPNANYESNGERTDFQEKMIQDRVTAKEFTLSTVYCEAPESTYEKCEDPPNQIPVCFCSFHNPSRDASLYGLYPGGTHIDQSAILVPSTARI